MNARLLGLFGVLVVVAAAAGATIALAASTADSNTINACVEKNAQVTIYPPFYTYHGLKLELAERVFVNQGCTFLDFAGIRLGERVMVGPKATFITVGHPVDTEDRRVWLTGGPIDVAENVWIGAGAMILPGVSIGRDSVIAAGAVVADDVPERSLVIGSKATVRRTW